MSLIPLNDWRLDILVLPSPGMLKRNCHSGAIQVFPDRKILGEDYFELRRARWRLGGTTPFSGTSLSILSVCLCKGLSSAEENCWPDTLTASPDAVYIASSKLVPAFPFVGCAT